MTASMLQRDHNAVSIVPELAASGDTSPSNQEYQLVPLQVSPEEWDACIQPYETALVYHGSAWLDYLEKSHNGRRVLLVCYQGATIIGYFCGMVIRKGPFRILGAPLKGWWTANMGPIASREEFDTAAFIGAFDSYCRKQKIDFVELCCDWLDPVGVANAGFTAFADVTHKMSLGDKQAAWSRMYKTTRNYVRRAE